MPALFQQKLPARSVAGVRLAPASPGFHATQSVVAHGSIRGVACVFKIARPDDEASAASVWRDLAISRELAPHPALLPVLCSGSWKVPSGRFRGKIEVPYLARPKFGHRLLRLCASGATARMEAVAAILAQLCNAIDHLRSHRVIHADLSPINILVDETFRLCLIDFGSARPVQDHPEQRSIHAGLREHEPPDTTWSDTFDLFSLGSILFLLTAEGSYFSWIFAGRPEPRFKRFIPRGHHDMIRDALRALSSNSFAERRNGASLVMRGFSGSATG